MSRKVVIRADSELGRMITDETNRQVADAREEPPLTPEEHKQALAARLLLYKTLKRRKH